MGQTPAEWSGANFSQLIGKEIVMARALVAQISELNRMPFEELRKKWEALYDGPSPNSSNRKQMVARLAYRIQELAFGGLSREARDNLDKIAEVDSFIGENNKPTGRNTSVAVPGTKLIREWQGKRIEVTTLEKGFEYAGKRYRSLTAIATEITGTKWNGPDFFGLRHKDENGKAGELAASDLTSAVRDN